MPSPAETLTWPVLILWTFSSAILGGLASIFIKDLYGVVKAELFKLYYGYSLSHKRLKYKSRESIVFLDTRLYLLEEALKRNDNESLGIMLEMVDEYVEKELNMLVKEFEERDVRYIKLKQTVANLENFRSDLHSVKQVYDAPFVIEEVRNELINSREEFIEEYMK